ncbi:hypothetical protein DdX_18092 [Ditylenchus destructor]|uniref:Uncharacterized protein n=1 Tax=Ditylenchus destructor TaxID=166010 RepID=A0AAD4QV76_9BILA|nr:hypothetical protein DdX_18092 [Ditylenchus destructor]
MQYCIFFFVYFSLILNFVDTRHCEGDGNYVDKLLSEPKLEDPKWEERCNGLPHNLTMGDDEDVPDSACKRRYCPACVIALREYCAIKLTNCHKSCCRLYQQFTYSDDTQELCEKMNADCGGLCGQMENKSHLAIDLIDEGRATPYKLCQVLELC